MVVQRAFALDAKHHMGIKGRYLELTALPDRWISWTLGAVPAGLSLIRKYRPQVIWSTFPIATAHLIGLFLHRITGLPWVADFRDPMLQPAYPTSRLPRAMYAWIERHTIERCHTAVFTTHSACDSYRKRFSTLPAEKFQVIENGYDEEGFGEAVIPPVSDKRSVKQRLTLLHSGVLYQTGRNPSPFLQAVAALKQQQGFDANSLRIVLRAPGDVEKVSELVSNAGVSDIVDVLPPLPYAAALEEMLTVDGLMVFQGKQFNTQIPAKVYEYFRARKPVLGLVSINGETAHVLRQAGFHDIADMDSTQSITPVLADFIEKIRQGSAHVASETLILASSRQQRAGELAGLFDAAALKA